MSKEQEEISLTMSREEQREIEREARLADNKRVAEARGLPLKLPRVRGPPMTQPGPLQSPASSAGSSEHLENELDITRDPKAERPEELTEGLIFRWLEEEEFGSESSLLSTASVGSDKAEATGGKTDKSKAKEIEKQVSHSEKTPIQSQQLPPVSQPVHPTQPKPTEQVIDA